MRRISRVDDLELDNHKSWYQPLDSEENVPFILVSEENNQCVVKVFKSRFPRIHAKCAMGPDSLLKTYKMTKSEYNVKSLIGSFQSEELDELSEESFELFSLDEQRRINLNEPCTRKILYMVRLTGYLRRDASWPTRHGRVMSHDPPVAPRVERGGVQHVRRRVIAAATGPRRRAARSRAAARHALT